MNQKVLATSLSKLRLFTLVTLIFQLHLSLSSDPLYETCLPTKCGYLQITYPFYDVHQQKSYCGYPGFEVFCHDGNIPYVNISGGSYVIHDISYDNQSFQISHPALVTSATGSDCFSSIKNLTLDGNIVQFATNHSEVILFRNCSSTILQEYKHDLIKCGALALYENDPRLKDLAAKCRSLVSVPYEYGSSSNITQALGGRVLLNWTVQGCSACIDSGGTCGFDRSASEFRCFCSDRVHAVHCAPLPLRKRKLLIAGPVAAGLALGIILIGLVVCLKRRRSSAKITVFSIKGLRDWNQNVEVFLRNYGSLAPKRYSYSDIRKMTNSFKHKLGEGGFGSVYKGTLLNGRLVAVKLLKQSKNKGDDFINEVASISRTNHVNVVTLIGFCFEGKNRALVYNFMSNGSLEKFIHGATTDQSLPLETLFKIAVGTARGLDYLHKGCNARILHFDIKPHNILLDEEFCPKISDFGLARLCLEKDSTISMLEARGTIGYIAPEVFCRNFGGVSHKSDVYSYGMMVLDMVCGRKDNFAQVQCSSDLYFPEWIYNRLDAGEEIALDVSTNDEQRLLKRKMTIVGLWCIQTYPSNRPSMGRVVEMLEGSTESLQMPPRSFLSSPPRHLSDSSSASMITL